ncbi:MAG: hypothetical protein D6784_14960, partial [Chloroflexi bacterium]
MNHIDLLTRAAKITWRYKPLWLFGFLLALCGGSGGGFRGNFNLPGGEEFETTSSLLNIDPALLVGIIVGVILLIFLLAIIGAVVQLVSRTALIGMVGQIAETAQVTIRDGWRIGWSRRAWRMFLVNLLFGIPVGLVAIFLIMVALAPLLLLLFGDEGPMIAGVLLTILAVLVVFILLVIISAVVKPFQEFSWRQIVLADAGVIDSVKQAFRQVRASVKDVAVLVIIMFGVGLLWGVASLVVILPVALVAAGLIGGIPALLVYVVTGSGLGAAIAGLP